MKEVIDPFINEIIRNALCEEIYSDDMVIAGGFATTLYYLSRQDEQTKRNFLLAVKLGIEGSHETIKFKKYFGDMDYWILDGSGAHDKWKDYLPKNSKEPRPYSDLKKEQAVLEGIFSYHSKHPILLKRNSGFSLTFAISPYSSKYNSKETLRLASSHQIIRKFVYPNIQSIFDKFDINLCKVAWKQNVLYVDDLAEKDFNNKSLTFSGKISELGNAFQEVWTALRLIKYNIRFGFQPGEKDIDQMLDLYMKAVDFTEEGEETQIKSKNKLLFGSNFFTKLADTVDVYESDKIRSIEVLRSSYGTFINNIPLILLFNNFKSTRAAYLLGKDYNKNHIIEKYLNQISTSGEKNGHPTENA